MLAKESKMHGVREERTKKKIHKTNIIIRRMWDKDRRKKKTKEWRGAGNRQEKNRQKNQHSKRNKENDKFSFNGKVFVFVLCKYNVERIKPNFIYCCCCCCCCAKYFTGFFLCVCVFFFLLTPLNIDAFVFRCYFVEHSCRVCMRVFVSFRHMVRWLGWWWWWRWETERITVNSKEKGQDEKVPSHHANKTLSRNKNKNYFIGTDVWETSSKSSIMFAFMHIHVEINRHVCVCVCFLGDKIIYNININSDVWAECSVKCQTYTFFHMNSALKAHSEWIKLIKINYSAEWGVEVHGPQRKRHGINFISQSHTIAQQTHKWKWPTEVKGNSQMWKVIIDSRWILEWNWSMVKLCRTSLFPEFRWLNILTR